jgi:DNA-binding MarR family transcriptional regulator
MTVTVAAHTRREHALTLTGAGLALVRKGDTLTERSRAVLLDAIDPDELNVALRVLNGVLDTLGA